jgi:hypothetical protein
MGRVVIANELVIDEAGEALLLTLDQATRLLLLSRGR